jgi:hypothetical protein
MDSTEPDAGVCCDAAPQGRSRQQHKTLGDGHKPLASLGRPDCGACSNVDGFACLCGRSMVRCRHRSPRPRGHQAFVSVRASAAARQDAYGSTAGLWILTLRRPYSDGTTALIFSELERVGRRDTHRAAGATATRRVARHGSWQPWFLRLERTWSATTVCSPHGMGCEAL